MSQLLTIFINILAPVFLLMLLGYLIGPRLQLETRTLSRFAYFVLTPAFVVDVLGSARIAADTATTMITYIIVVHLILVAIGFGVARLLKRPAPMVGAYMLIAVFGNVGNFGLPIIKFAYGEQALVEATVYFLAILTISFIVGVGAANWHKGGRFTAAIAVFKTPAILALPPALLLNWTGMELPPFLGRGVELLADALIPTMLVALGVQLAHVGLPRLNADMLLASTIKLVGGAALALALAIPFGLSGLERSIGVLQASMPTAVLASMIAVEHDLVPQFVIATVLVCTLASVVTLTIVLAVLGV